MLTQSELELLAKRIGQALHGGQLQVVTFDAEGNLKDQHSSARVRCKLGHNIITGAPCLGLGIVEGDPDGGAPTSPHV